MSDEDDANVKKMPASVQIGINSDMKIVDDDEDKEPSREVSEEARRSAIAAAAAHAAAANPYSTRYRVAKTAALVIAWLSYGVNMEMIGPTLEDLRLLLGFGYTDIAFGMVMRSLGNVLFIPFSGILLDRFSRHAELVLVIGSIFIAIPNFLLTMTSVYWLTMSLFFVQGLAAGCYDVAGNRMLFELWKGLPNLPINAMHAGFGIGAAVAVQLAKPFLVATSSSSSPNNSIASFNSTNNNSNSTWPDTQWFLVTDNSSNVTNSSLVEEVNAVSHISVPYMIAGSISLLVANLFIVFQIVELRIRRRVQAQLAATKRKSALKLESLDVLYSRQAQLLASSGQSSSSGWSCVAGVRAFLFKLFFGDKIMATRGAVVYTLVQLVLIMSASFFMQGCSTLVSKFAQTYLTRGPAKFSNDQYANVQTVFWFTFVASRLITTLVLSATTCNPLAYLFSLFVFNTLASFAFVWPTLVVERVFYWLGMAMLGLSVGPCIPTVYMVSKRVLNDYNSFVMSLMICGNAFSTMAFQKIAGWLLDVVGDRENFLGFEHFEAPYVIGPLMFVSSLCASLIFTLSVLANLRYKRLIMPD